MFYNHPGGETKRRGAQRYPVAVIAVADLPPSITIKPFCTLHITLLTHSNCYYYIISDHGQTGHAPGQTARVWWWWRGGAVPLQSTSASVYLKCTSPRDSLCTLQVSQDSKIQCFMSKKIHTHTHTHTTIVILTHGVSVQPLRAPYSSGSGLTVGFMGIWDFLNTLNWTRLYKLALMYTLTNSHLIPHSVSQWSIDSARWRYCTNGNSYIFWLHWNCVVTARVGQSLLNWHTCPRPSLHRGTLSSPGTTASHCRSGRNFQQSHPAEKMFFLSLTRGQLEQPSLASCPA